MKKNKKIEKKLEDKSNHISFLDAKGKKTLVNKTISENETWLLEKRNLPKALKIISHAGIIKIARKAGIGTSYEIAESLHIVPSPENSYLHVVEVKVECYAKKVKTGGCIHNAFERVFRMTGEADKKNTGRGRDYLRTMAEKRGYDRAVLKHLQLEGVYSEEEAQAFEEDAKSKMDVLSEEEIKSIVDLINGLIVARTKAELEKVVKVIKGNTAKFNENQLQYLRKLYSETNSRIVKVF